MRGSTTGLKEKVALACRILANAGLADYLGHVSARVNDQDTVVIRARGLEAGSMLTTSPNKILSVGLDGRSKEKTRTLVPPSETPLHTRIYLAREDVLSVVHVHARTPVVLSLVDLPILPVFNQGLELANEGIPVYPKNSLITTDELGDEVAQALGSKSSCVLFAHGIVTVGRSVEEASVRALRLETIAQVNLNARLLGEPRAIPPSDCEAHRPVAEREILGEWRYQVKRLRDTNRR